MFKYQNLENLILKYKDEETGLCWNIQVFSSYRSADRDTIILVITDYIRVEIDRFKMSLGLEYIIDEIYKTYTEKLNG